MASEETLVIVVERYVAETEPLLLWLNGDEVGVPIFDAVDEALRFIEAFWEVLGPGYEPVEVPVEDLGELLLRRCANQAGCAIINPSPSPEEGWQVIELGRFAEALGGPS